MSATPQGRGLPPRPQIRLDRRRILLISIVVLAFVGLISARGIAGFYTDFLWFRQLGYAGVWRGVVGVKILLGVLFTAVAFAVILFNLWLADRLQPPANIDNIEDLMLARYHQVVGPRIVFARIAVAAVLALILGPVMASRWDDWLLFRNSQPFGVRDAQFNRDVSFYVFRLPFLSGLVSWLFSLMLLSVLVSIVAHYLNGGIRVQPPVARITSAVKVHVSVLLAIVAAVRAVGYYLQQAQLAYSGSGVVDGLGYTDIHARLPALKLLVVISLASMVLFLVNIRQRGWVMPILAVGLWGVVSVVVGEVYPRVTQWLRVRPDEADREALPIERNIAATRAAFGLDGVTVRNFPYTPRLDSADLAKDPTTVSNIRVWDAESEFGRQSFRQLQSLRQQFSINDVDVDRYEIDGKVTPVLVAARDLALDQALSRAKSWVNRHLTFTHGFGLVAARANATGPGGQPDFTLKGLPPTGTPALTQPRIYFGEGMDGFAIVNAKAPETDFPLNNGQSQTFVYDGKGGVKLGSVARRLAFALRFGDPNVLISSAVTSESKLLYIRDVRQRAATIAPFLRLDADPYPVAHKGRILWVLDAYTTTSRYPYSQTARTDVLENRPSGLRTSYNYVRNSVKIVTDAYDGTTQMYVIDGKDPIAKAYRSAFPRLLRSSADFDRDYPGLREHFRYPEDMFRVQAGMYGRYHIDEPSDFYNRSDAWDVSPDPGTGILADGAPRQVAVPKGTVAVVPTTDYMAPHYQYMELPGEDRPDFVIQHNFVPLADESGRAKVQTQTAFLIGRSDPGTYGQLVVYELPRDTEVNGPPLRAASINQTVEVSQTQTQLGIVGSEVLLGNLQVLPVGDSLLYVRSLYVQSEDRNSQVPEVKRVIVMRGDQVVIKPTLAQAMAEMFGTSEGVTRSADDRVPTTTAPGGGTGGSGGTGGTATTRPGSSGTPTTRPSGSATGPETLESLLLDADRAYEAAQAALKAGDLAEYQRQVNEVGRLVERALARGGVPVTTSSVTTPATTSPTAVTVPLSRP